jgi:hypothetical protein
MAIMDYQYLLSRGQAAVPEPYQTVEIGGQQVSFDRRFRCCELRDASGRIFATLIGFAYHKRRRGFLPAGLTVFEFDVDEAKIFEQDVIPDLAGAFLLITHGQLPRRLYLDPGGSLPIVYSSEHESAGASAAMLLDEPSYIAQFDHDLYKAMIEREGAGGWISGTLTAHKGIRRLLPNHYLDLENWRAKRYWPQVGDFKSWMKFDQAVSVVAESLRAFTEAVCKEFHMAMTLTAGFDSRLMLASARHARDVCSFFTFTSAGSEIDVHTAQRLSERFQLQHRVIPVREASGSEELMWDRAVGDCVVEKNRLTHPTLRMVDAEGIMTGMYGELGRCRLYRQDLREINSTTIDSRFIVSRLTLPSYPPSDENMVEWFSGVASLPNSVILDLAFLELKFGSWAMGQHPIQNALKLHFFPFSQRDVLQSFMAVEPSEKGTERLFRSCIERLWPELNEVPVNSYGDYRDYLVVLEKLANPARVRRFLRDRFARKINT